MKLLFVCLGNICRSPAAEAVMRSVVEKQGLAAKFTIDSAGTYGGHSGQPSHPQMRAAAQRRGYRMTHSARQFSPADFDNFDMILTMDEQNYSDVARMGTPVQLGKLRRMADFCDGQHEVPDPYGHPDHAFEHVLDILEKGCENLSKYLNGAQ